MLNCIERSVDPVLLGGVELAFVGLIIPFLSIISLGGIDKIYFFIYYYDTRRSFS